ncbi:peptidoglycan-binding protein [Candidatus Gracilibacteria bacterium]|nr:peptidoglycan-binding protein [Candidatus Gracilibacteria bacterium]
MKRKFFILSTFIFTLVFIQNTTTFASNYSDIHVDNISNGNSKVSWKNDSTPTNSYINLGTAPGQYSKYVTERCAETSDLQISTNSCINLSNLEPGKTYYYRIISSIYDSVSNYSGTNNTNQIITSDEQSFTTPELVSETPNTPTNLAASATTYSSGSISSSPSIRVTWVDNSTNESSFKLSRITSGGTSTILPAIGANTTSYTDTNVSASNSYSYTIQACNGDRCSQLVSSPLVSISAPITCTSLAMPTISCASNLESYGVPTNQTSGNANLTKNSCTNIVTYNGGCSVPETVVLVNYIPTKPEKVSAVFVSPNSVDLKWVDKSDNESRFEIYRSTGNSVSTLISTINSNSSNFTDSNLSRGTYNYSLSSCNNSGCSQREYFSQSIEIPDTLVPTSIIPQQPTNLRLATSTVLGTSKTTLSWSAVGGATSYRILGSNGVNSVVTTTSMIVGENQTPGTYTYYVSACSAQTNCSTSVSASMNIPEVTTVVVTTLAPISPTNLRLSTTTSSSLLSWSTINGLVYNVRSGNNFEANNVSSPFNVGTLYPGRHEYSVQACESTPNGIGRKCSDFTSTSIVIPEPYVLLKPTSPINPTANVLSSYNNSATVNISWLDKSDNETKFKIIRTVSDQSKTYELSSGTQFFTDYGLTSGLYHYSISACNTSGCSNPAQTSVTVADSPSRILSGTVSLLDGKTVPNAKVYAYNTVKSIVTVTDSLGKYELTLPGGTYTVEVSEENTNSPSWVVDSINLSISNNNETANFIAKPLQSTLNVKVVDNFGSPVSNIGVVILPSNASSDVKASTQVTNSSGNSSALISPGNYHVRTIFSETLPYINATEQLVTVSNNETKQVTMIIRKKVTSNITEIRGVTKFDDNIPTQAFVSAWSDKGGYKSVISSNETGVFVLTISKDDVWHINAKKDSNGISYKTTELTIDPNDLHQPVSLYFTKSKLETLPPAVTKRVKKSETVNLTTSDGAGISLASNSTISTNSSDLVDVEVKTTIEAPSQKSSEVVSKVYDITIKDNAGEKITTLSDEAQITLPYDEGELRAQGITVESLIPSYYDENIGTWISVPKFRINKDTKTFTLFVQHLTRFALIASADTTPPSSPTNIVTDAITPTDVRISWNNPTVDYDHSKVYRSEIFGSFGDLVAAEVYTNSFIDKTYSINGKTYYYTVRSVDAAGNESNNNNQVAFAVQGNQLAQVQQTTSLLLPPGQDISGQITRNMSKGSRGADVTLLQKTLKYDGFYATGPITGYFGPLTENAVFRFQNYYKEEVLYPVNLKVGTGYFGPSTKKKVNEIIANASQ